MNSSQAGPSLVVVILTVVAVVAPPFIVAVLILIGSVIVPTRFPIFVFIDFISIVVLVGACLFILPLISRGGSFPKWWWGSPVDLLGWSCRSNSTIWRGSCLRATIVLPSSHCGSFCVGFSDTFFAFFLSIVPTTAAMAIVYLCAVGASAIYALLIIICFCFIFIFFLFFFITFLLFCNLLSYIPSL